MKGGEPVKKNFCLGLGLGAAATAAAMMLMKPKSEMEKVMDKAKQTVDQTVNKIGG